MCSAFLLGGVFADPVIVNPNRQNISWKKGSSTSSSGATVPENGITGGSGISEVANTNPYTGTSSGRVHTDYHAEDYAHEQTNEERRLFNYLMRNYDNTIRPVLNATTPVTIRLGITLTQIFDLDEKNQVLTTLVWLDQEWVDEFLTWNPSDFGGIQKIRVPCQSIWLPDIVLYNKFVSIFENFDHKYNLIIISADDYTRGYMNSRAVVEPNGNVFWPPPTKFRSTCEVDVTYFPFDDQTCSLRFGGAGVCDVYNIYENLETDSVHGSTTACR